MGVDTKRSGPDASESRDRENILCFNNPNTARGCAARDEGELGDLDLSDDLDLPDGYVAEDALDLSGPSDIPPQFLIVPNFGQFKAMIHQVNARVFSGQTLHHSMVAVWIAREEEVKASLKHVCAACRR